MQSSHDSDIHSEDHEPYSGTDIPSCPQCQSRRAVVDIHGYPMAPPEDVEYFEAGVDVHGQWFFAEPIPYDGDDLDEDDDEFSEEYSYTTITGEPAVPTSEIFVRDFFGSRTGIWWHIAGCVIEMPDDMFPYQCRDCGHVWGYEPYEVVDE
mgnify:CR=1 FL=1